MNIHDWTRVPTRRFHDFHASWITHFKDALNAGLLPPGYVARSEQWFNRRQSDVLTLGPLPPPHGPAASVPPPGSVALADAPPRVRLDKMLQPGTRTRHRSVVVRRIDDEEVVALIEIVSPANKDRAENVATLVAKVTTALRAGVHALVVDLLPPTAHIPDGWHAAISDELAAADEDDVQPADTPIAALSYASQPPDVRAFAEFVAVGQPLPDLPLFLTPTHYVRAPLAASYAHTFGKLAEADRNRLDPP